MGEGGSEGGAEEEPRDGRGPGPPRVSSPGPKPQRPRGARGRSRGAPPALTAGLVSYIGSRHLGAANHFRRERAGWGPAPCPPEVGPATIFSSQPEWLAGWLAGRTGGDRREWGIIRGRCELLNAKERPSPTPEDPLFGGSALAPCRAGPHPNKVLWVHSHWFFLPQGPREGSGRAGEGGALSGALVGCQASSSPQV